MKIEFNNTLKSSVKTDFVKKIVDIFSKIEKINNDIEVSVAIIDDKEMRRLNKSYRGIDFTTDVLSFSSKDKARNFPVEKKFWGEVLISYPQAVKQSKDHKHAIKKEIAILLIHGLAHLAQYDHSTNAKEIKMKKLEEEVLKKVFKTHYV